MRKGSVSAADIERIKDIANDPAKFEEWLKYVEVSEPEFYVFIQNTTSKIISSFGQNIKFNMQDASLMAHSILMAFTAGFAMQHERNNSRIEMMYNSDILKDKFQLWLDGRMPDTYYSYSLRGVDKSSSKYKAKQNHIDLIKKEKEKTHISDELRSFIDLENSLNGKKTMDRASNILSDDDLEEIK